MSLFQIQVERQYLSGITTDLTPIYEKYRAYFGNPEIQANILEVKEEQYQGEFIRALFVDILGYTAQPQPNFNLLREKKNETDAKSADAAVIINNQTVAVIELKDHKTQDLKKIETQAFGYKNNHKNCRYIVTSNFERLRFYIENAVDFIEFDLFNLTADDFKRLWLCLSFESLAKDLPLEIKNQSISSEDKVTKELYKDYSVFKRQLFDSIVALNPDYDKLLLFKKTQKLLDRFLFLFFAEDKELLPANSVKGTVDKWKKFNADPMNDYQPLYTRFVKYFKLLDEGYKDANTEIYAYNGGLFANDELLNQIKVEDAVLSKNVLILAEYGFATEVDVNILGHIFENSLNEIEQVANEISTGVKTTSKRKQDGVFYTPRYITQYIVENTVGRLCEEKKTELGIGEELFDFKSAKKKDEEQKKKDALKVFDDYREWLLHISIVDPACGSGAFLNRALDFLIAEHGWIDRQQERITGLKGHYSMELSNIENTILENNLFGVDINDESVEIAKLSLWLRTAKPHRKLNSLNNNIKCGNSLIDDPAVAGEKAFDWHKEFPQIFILKEKKIWHVTWVTHDTRTSARMIKYKVREMKQNGEGHIDRPYYFDEKEAIEITRIISDIIAENEFNCLEYNVCDDHVHIMLVCSEEDLPQVVRKLKGKSAQKFKEYLGLDKEETFHLWAQKFDRNCITLDAELQTLINTIYTTGAKQQLPDIYNINKGLQPLANTTITGDSMLPANSIQDADINSNKGLQPLVNVTSHINSISAADTNGLQITDTLSAADTGKVLPANSILDADINKGLQPLVEKTPVGNSNSELQTKINYIRKNREKHGLPDTSKGLQPLVEKMRCTLQYAFRPEYKGGFDVVIGNPPYVQLSEISSTTDLMKKYLIDRYKSSMGRLNTYAFFIKLALEISKDKGLNSYIIPNTILTQEYYKKIRFDLINDSEIIEIVQFLELSFADAVVENIILSFKNQKPKDNYINIINSTIGKFSTEKEILQINFIDNIDYNFNIYDKKENKSINAKLKQNTTSLGDISEVNQAIALKGSRDFWVHKESKDSNYVKVLEGGKNINRYTLNWGGDYLDYNRDGIHSCNRRDIFESTEKIFFRRVANRLIGTLDTTQLYALHTIVVINIKDDYKSKFNIKYILALFNSKLLSFYYKINFISTKTVFTEIGAQKVRELPIKNIDISNQLPFIAKADAMLSYNKELQLLVGKFQRMVQRKFGVEELPGKLQNWYTLTYKEFIAELGKKKVKLSLAQEAEWEEYFHAEQAKALEIKKQIDDTDHEIDKMVYALYELTDEEVKIVEGE